MTDTHADHDAASGESRGYREADEEYIEDLAYSAREGIYGDDRMTSKERDEALACLRELVALASERGALLDTASRVWTLESENTTLRAEVERLTAVVNGDNNTIAMLVEERDDRREMDQAFYALYGAVCDLNAEPTESQWDELRRWRDVVRSRIAPEPFRPRTCGTHAHADDLIDGDTPRLPEEER